jgi:hypothetical protein
MVSPTDFSRFSIMSTNVSPWPGSDDAAIAAALKHLCEMAESPIGKSGQQRARASRAPGRDVTNVRKVAPPPQPRKDASIVDQTQRWIEIYRSTPTWRPPIPGEPAENDEVCGCLRLRSRLCESSLTRFVPCPLCVR